MIVLLHDKASVELQSYLSPLGEVLVLPDKNALQDYLLSKGLCDLVVCAVDGAAGMNICIAARKRRCDVPVIWITEQKEFLPQSMRIPVAKFMLKPIAPTDVVTTAQRLLCNKQTNSDDVFCNMEERL